MTKNVFVSIMGKANVGKSSLMNCIMGEKIAIVTNKPQTTRNRITGILTEGELQYVFIDTPGLHTPKSKLGSYMVKEAKQSIAGADVVALVIEWHGDLNDVEKALIESLKSSSLPVILVINKIDTLVDKEKLLKKIALVSSLCKFDAVVPVCALTGEGVDDFLSEVRKHSVTGHHFFDDDALTDMPERAIAAEIIREKLLMNLREEIPHGTAVMIEKMRQRESQEIMDIEACIVCEKESHKGIIIGKGGNMLKNISTKARMDIEDFLGIKVNLKCFVRIKEGWRDSEIQLKNFGFNND